MCDLLSHVRLFAASWTAALQAPRSMGFSRLLGPWDCPGKNTGVGCHALLQGIFPTQGLNVGLLHCRRIVDRLSRRKPHLAVCDPIKRMRVKRPQQWEARGWRSIRERGFTGAQLQSWPAAPRMDSKPRHARTWWWWSSDEMVVPTVPSGRHPGSPGSEWHWWHTLTLGTTDSLIFGCSESRLLCADFL